MNHTIRGGGGREITDGYTAWTGVSACTPGVKQKNKLDKFAHDSFPRTPLGPGCEANFFSPASVSRYSLILLTPDARHRAPFLLGPKKTPRVLAGKTAKNMSIFCMLSGHLARGKY